MYVPTALLGGTIVPERILLAACSLGVLEEEEEEDEEVPGPTVALREELMILEWSIPLAFPTPIPSPVPCPGPWEGGPMAVKIFWDPL